MWLHEYKKVNNMRIKHNKKTGQNILPGFNLTLGYALFYLSLIVLIPLSAVFIKTFTLTWPEFVAAVASQRVMASYKLTFGASLIAALINVVFGLLTAWVLTRYHFFGKKFIDAFVDFPFERYMQPMVGLAVCLSHLVLR
jgi:sulfate/thiosulfate transport system permease protein